MVIFVTQEVSVIWKWDHHIECSRILNRSYMIFIAKVINEFLRLFSTWTDFRYCIPLLLMTTIVGAI